MQKLWRPAMREAWQVLLREVCVMTLEHFQLGMITFLLIIIYFRLDGISDALEEISKKMGDEE